MTGNDTTHAPLSVGDVLDLAKLIEFGAANQRVVRAIDDGNGDYNLVEGVARSLGKDGGGMAWDTDVRDMYLWVSGTFEYFWPVSELLDDMRNGRFGARS